MIETLFVANRGAIARRIFRTAAALGKRTVACYSDADRYEPYVDEADLAVPLKGYRAADTYLNIEALVAAATRSGADAVHPGYGFLSENADFAEACGNADLTFVGPSPASIRQLGSKIAAKDLANRSNVPTLPSVTVASDVAEAASKAATMTFPLLVKPSAGGGGKGMRVVLRPEDLKEALLASRREAESSFGDPTLFIERYIEKSRHIEIQIFGDGRGNAVHFGERECSIQRRHQKIIEESPSTIISPGVRDRMTSAAVQLAADLSYAGAGTVEYLLAETQDEAEFWFLEMNTRLQVEHAVTEERTGFDLVALQLHVAEGGELPKQQDIHFRGHAVEARLYAENPARNFIPSPGVISTYEHPSPRFVRFEDGLATGSRVTEFYDPMIAKVIAWGPDRATATARLRAALSATRLTGVETNRDHLCAILNDDDFRAGLTTTDFVDRHPNLTSTATSETVRDFQALAAALHLLDQGHSRSTTSSIAPARWRLLPRSDTPFQLLIGGEARTIRASQDIDEAWAVNLDGQGTTARVFETRTDSITLEFAELRRTCWIDHTPHSWQVSVDGHTASVSFPSQLVGASDAQLSTRAALPGMVTSVAVEKGHMVTLGQTLLVLEAMKMEHTVTADRDGVVAVVHVRVGDSVAADQVLVTIENTEDTGR